MKVPLRKKWNFLIFKAIGFYFPKYSQPAPCLKVQDFWLMLSSSYKKLTLLVWSAYISTNTKFRNRHFFEKDFAGNPAFDRPTARNG